jgi:alkylated DNA repair dioxygenase AlkB
MNTPPRGQVIVQNAVVHVPAWLTQVEADQYGYAVVQETHQRWASHFKFGRGFDRGHAMARFGDRGITYTYKGKSKPMHPMTPTLTTLQQLVSEELGWAPNCVVVNSYEPSSGLYPHRDSTYIPQLGSDPTIVAVSFGATRTFQLHPHNPVTNKYDRSKPTIDLELGHGDLLIMYGQCDSLFKHGIPEQPERTGTRVSLTFRRHVF